MIFPESVVIQVTPADIGAGERKNACRCPVARAACRVFGFHVDNSDVAVENCIDIWVPDLGGEGNSGWARYEIPAAISDWIDSYDAGHVVPVVEFCATRIGDIFE